MSNSIPREAWSGCPIPSEFDRDRITLAHGEGGRLSRTLIRERLLSRLDNEQLRLLGDAAQLSMAGQRVAFSTDGYTVTPLFFPGGDIGQLAVFGTVNDLAVAGALPRWLSLGLIIEEGLSWSVFDRVLDSIRNAAMLANIEIVTGDTKVVPCGAADKLFITTSGIGELMPSVPPGPSELEPGDALLVSGPIGGHGAAILCAREQFEFDPAPVSDCAPLTAPLMALLKSGVVAHAIRDATRGGVAAVLHEWAEASQLTCTVDEGAIPVTMEVRAVCELLGLDPLHLANEGTCVLAVPFDLVETALTVLHQFEVSRGAKVIGHVGPQRRNAVTVVRVSGRETPLDEPSGAPLPRIC